MRMNGESVNNLSMMDEMIEQKEKDLTFDNEIDAFNNLFRRNARVGTHISTFSTQTGYNGYSIQRMTILGTNASVVMREH